MAKLVDGIDYRLARNKKVKIGLKNVQRSTGQEYEIIEWNGTKDILVRFEDGTEVKTSFSAFNAGYVENPNFTYRDRDRLAKKNSLIGESKTAANGMRMTVLDYDGHDSITVRFEDGQKVKCRLSSFRTGYVSHPGLVGNAVKNVNRNNRVGFEFKTVQGLNGVVLEYGGTTVVKVKLETGLEKVVNWSNVKSGKVFDPDYTKKTFIGKRYHTQYGIDAEIIHYNNSHDIGIRFEDGYENNKTSLATLQKGRVEHPYLPTRVGGVRQYNGMTVKLAFTTNTDRYYICRCSKCEFSECLPVKQMLVPHVCPED